MYIDAHEVAFPPVWLLAVDAQAQLFETRCCGVNLFNYRGTEGRVVPDEHGKGPQIGQLRESLHDLLVEKSEEEWFGQRERSQLKRGNGP